MEKSRYIAIEGPIGVGKSSLVDLLARELGGRTLMEAVDDNPFLPRFYGDIKKYAFQTQLFFLLSRYQQQKEMFQQELFNTSVVSDYLFAKDRIFAYLNLDENELCLYEQVYRLLDTRIPKPDLVIYLQASTEVLLERIAGRNIDYEKHVREEYLERLVDAYNRYFFYYSDTPLLVVNTTEIDFVNNPDDLSSLVKEIRSMKGGSQHYIPIASS
ncbi:MAG TPA: deoxynucleoside kinase [Deltaproteobacteria bacterium]|nr:MAG: deoxyadenosine kinase [Deltaproteobacteria bacterium GWA2_55_82]OGQ62310.1 MAG: deoxyadenosine kinase [Deltaproteobacteria bacterium RIFCSPLOWO2_02_FULL_55_12]OIJ74422.1 MAG: deoxyadenosine kinase [Deltaproteobacteria bacterium GWC2_55_46]HBG47074.1 deoxynucleoside kinase [Deltaproteobacteria bacterium]HCY10867.1 deoxynucleoside kinase [Deltaproteobacteria bacterium]